MKRFASLIVIMSLFSFLVPGVSANDYYYANTSGGSYVDAYKPGGGSNAAYVIVAEGGGSYYAEGHRNVSGGSETSAQGAGFAWSNGSDKMAGAAVTIESREWARTDCGYARATYEIWGRQSHFVHFYNSLGSYYYAGNETGGWSSDYNSTSRGIVTAGGKVDASGLSGGEFKETENSQSLRSFTIGGSMAQNYRNYDPGVYGQGDYGGYVQFGKGFINGSAGYSGAMAYTAQTNGTISGNFAGCGGASVTVNNGPGAFSVTSKSNSQSSVGIKR